MTSALLGLLLMLPPVSGAWAAITNGPSVNGVTSTTHTASVASSNSAMGFSWTAATSDQSGIFYEYAISSSATMDAVTFENQRGLLFGATTLTLPDQADGTWYFYIRAADASGIVGATGITRAGPYPLDSAPTLDATTPIAPGSGAHPSAQNVTVRGSNFMNGATLRLVNGKRSTPSGPVALAEVALTNVTVIDSGQITATVPAGTAPGVYDLKVTNGLPWSKTATTLEKYTSTNQIPVATASGDQTVSLSNGQASVSFHGSASSDPDGDAVASYTWTLTSMPANADISANGVALGVNATLSGVSQTVVAKTAGSYLFTLMVGDGYDNSASASLTITVNAAAGSNNAPVANPGSDFFAVPGSPVTLSGANSSDPDGDTLTTYTWAIVSKPTGSTLSSISQGSPPLATFTPDVKGNYVISLVVNDGKVVSEAKSVTVTANNPPVANAGSAQTVAVGEVATLDGTGSYDADGDTRYYAWTQTAPASPVVTLSSSSAANPTFTPTVAGPYVFSLVVNDGLQNSTNTSTVTITADTRPVANAGANQYVVPGSTVTLDGSASSDADAGTTLNHFWSQTSGPAVTLSSSALVKPTFTAPNTAATMVFALTVNDGLFASATPATVTVITNHVPVANPGSSQTVTVPGTVTLDASSSSDADDPSLTYAWTVTSQPPGSAVALSSNTEQKPIFSPVCNGDYVFSLVVSDGKQSSAASSVTVTYSGGSTCVTLDVDKSGTSNATDGVLILRRLNGASTITTGVVLPSGQTNTTVKATIDGFALGLDVDKSGGVNATDGVLILRRLNGASTITTGVVLPSGQTNTTVRSTIDAIK
ncbi:MAG: hypothetical protein HQM03_12985 [Magnetococcales bacterium]|nr:hypothetical protein [Magnetococcales bacterium]